MLQQSTAPPQRDPGAAPRGRRVVDVVSVLAVVAPFLVAAGAVLLGREVVLGGDQALLALDSSHLLNLEQPLGAYSRMGWAHPGPAWLAMLAPLYWVFGSTGTALIAAALVVHAVFAALVVLLAGTDRAWTRPLMAAVLLGWVLLMPAPFFVGVWNPYATLFPTVLLLLLAARACAGSVVALAGGLVVGSFLVQTHIGTAPLVVLVLLLPVLVLGRRLLRDPATRPDRRAQGRAALLAGGAVLLWLPPLWQQLTAPAGRGNLGLIVEYLRDGGPEPGAESRTWAEGVSAVGQMLGAPLLGWQRTPGPVDVGIRDVSVLALVAAHLLAAVVVVLVGRRVPGRQGAWLGAVTGLAVVAGLVAARTVTGEVQNYLLVWVSALPAVVVFAALRVAVDRWDRRRLLSGRPALVGLSAGVVALAVAAAVALLGPTGGDLADQPAGAEAARMALEVLPGPEEASPVLLDIPDVGVWTTATTVALELEQAGYRVVVEEEWVYGFGSDRAASGDERWRVVLRPLTSADAPARPGQVGVVGSGGGPAAVLVRPVD